MPPKNPPKPVPVANRNTPKTVSIPGFGKFPDWVKPEAYWPIPFPHQFHSALFFPPEYRDKPLPGPFSQSWMKAWTGIGSAVSKQSEKKCKDFFSNDGYQALMELGQRGCDPNLVMSLLVRYLWDERAPSSESKDPNIRGHIEDLDAIKRTRDLFENHTWKRTAQTELINCALRQLEDIVQSYISDLDFRDLDFRDQRGNQNAKQNRVIFALYHHLRQRTPGTGPQWSLFLKLLVDAGAIVKTTGSGGPPDGRIMPRIKVFKRDHPNEANLIPRCVRDWPLSHFPYPPSALA